MIEFEKIDGGWRFILSAALDKNGKAGVRVTSGVYPTKAKARDGIKALYRIVAAEKKAAGAK